MKKPIKLVKAMGRRRAVWALPTTTDDVLLHTTETPKGPIYVLTDRYGVPQVTPFGDILVAIEGYGIVHAKWKKPQ